MTYEIRYHEKVIDDIRQLRLTKSQLQKLKDKLEFISKNPYPKSVGGLGEPLSGELKGLLKFRFWNVYRVIYKLEEKDGVMKILIIGLRKDMLVYDIVKKRI